MGKDSSIARRLDDSILGIIIFLGTLWVTWGSYLVKPNGIFQSINSDDDRRSQSFTLLAVSAFLYAIIVGSNLYHPGVNSDSFADQIPRYLTASDVALNVYENIKHATASSLLLHAMPLLLAIFLGIYFFSRLFFREETNRNICIKVLTAGFATQLFLLSAIHAFILLSVEVFGMELYFNAAYYLFCAYATLIPWFAYLAFDKHVKKEKPRFYLGVFKYFAALIGKRQSNHALTVIDIPR